MKNRLGDRLFSAAAHGAGLFVLALLGTIIVLLFIGGLPAFRAFGPGFLVSSAWNPVTEKFGALVSVYGTVASSVLALLMAVPLAFGVAFFLTELAPAWMRRPVGTAIELLAAVPSIIYGMWGFFVLAPVIRNYVEPPLSSAAAWISDLPDASRRFAMSIESESFGNSVLHFLVEALAIPFRLLGGLLDILQVSSLTHFFRPAPGGSGIFTAALVLAIMITPFIAATMRDVFLTVPVIFKESAFGLGCTSWEVMRRIVLPYTRASVIGGIMLGLGRALGETMAVTFVIGNTNRISPNVFAPGNTIASLVALEFPEADQGSLQLASLLALGFILFVISFVVLAISRGLLVQRARA